MSLKEQLRSDLKDAMRNKETLRRTVIRGLMTAINEAEQRQREDLIAAALEEHGVERPREQTDEALAAYDEQVQSVMEEENIEERAELDDPDVLGIVQKLVKQRQDSIEEANKAGRADIAEQEQAELEILEAYLPRQMSREEVAEEVKAMIDEVGASSMKDMGRVMGPLMEKLKGRADGSLVSQVVREQLQG